MAEVYVVSLFGRAPPDLAAARQAARGSGLLVLGAAESGLTVA